MMHILPAAFLSIAVAALAMSPLRASEPSSHPAKTRMVPRPLPGGANGLGNTSPSEDPQLRKPVRADAPNGGATAARTEEKARIVAIRRAVSAAAVDGNGSTAKPSPTAQSSDQNPKSRVPSRIELPPVGPGQIRVHPQTEVKASSPAEVKAQPTP